MFTPCFARDFYSCWGYSRKQNEDPVFMDLAFKPEISVYLEKIKIKKKHK